MRRTLVVRLTLVALVVVAGAAAQASAGRPAGDAVATRTAASVASVGQFEATAGASGDACEALAGGEQRSNPVNDTLGWENGCWHDDPFAVTVDDGLNETELDAVVARTMARVEAIRGLEFEETVPVEVVSRETFREATAGGPNVSDRERLRRNVKYEALFFVGEDEDAVAQVADNRAGTVLGYYAPAEDRIVVVSDSEGALAVDGPTLVHELAHALQDQHFNLSRYNRSTTERENAVLGVLEGDPTYIEYRYDQRCEDGWTCPSRDGDIQPRPGPSFDWGIYFMGFQPYSDGAPFVAGLRDDGGWPAVDAAYHRTPASSEQVIHPRKYPNETPERIRVADRSGAQWRPLDVQGGVDHAAYGEAGMAAMFIAPTFDAGDEAFVTAEAVLTGDELDPVNYSLPASAGWDGDRLVPYVNYGSGETNETGYVWKSAWDDPAEAEEFAEAYVRMLAYRGAAPVDGHVDTYRIPDEEAYGDAFYVNRTGDTVVVVNAPTVVELANVRSGAAPRTPTPTEPSSDPAVDRPLDGTTPTTGTGADAPLPPGTTVPGLGLVVAAAALVVAALLVRRR